MKRLLSLGILLVFYLSSYAQFNFSLSGSPVNTTGWTLNAPFTYVNQDSLVLNDTTSKNIKGYVHTDDSVCLTSCSYFVAKFDFQITDHGPQGAGDGMAFWYIQNPPSVSAAPTVMGFPNNARGFAVVFDTHNGDGVADNPIVSPRRLSTFSGTYNEGITSNVIGGTELYNQTQIIDGNWHHCEVTFNKGQLTVSVDNGPQVGGMISNANALFNFCGRFGFSSQTTNANYSKHSIRNVEIIGYEAALPVVEPVSIGYRLCQDTSVPGVVLYDTVKVSGDSLIWYDKNMNPIAGPPLIPLDTIKCDTFFVAAYHAQCNSTSPVDTVRVCVEPKPTTPVLPYGNTTCQGDPFLSVFTPPPGFIYFWYDTPVGGTPTTTSPNPSVAQPDTIIWYLALKDPALDCEGERVAYPFYILEAPDANFDSLIAFGCNGDTVTFSNLTAVGDSCIWIYGDGGTDTANSRTHPNWSPTHIYYTQNRFVVRLIVFNKGTGCVDSIDKVLNNVHPLQALFEQSADTICQGTPVQFRDTSDLPIFGGNSFFWDFGDGDTSYTQDPTHIYTRPGVYTVMHVVTDFVPCSDTIYRDFYVDSLGVMGFTINDTSICEGDLIKFTGEFTDIGLRDYFWDFGDGNVIPDVNPVSHAYDDAGIFTVTFHGNYRICPVNDSIKQITVNPYPSINLGLDTTICPNGEGVILADATNQFVPGAKWLWSTGDSTFAITARHAGIYTARITLNGCASSDSVQVFKDCYIDIPNVFTPNGDGSNDYFLPRQLLSKSVSKFNMQVFNRWGDIVFKTDKLDGRGWDGRLSGKDQPVGTYVYLIDVEFGNGTKERYQGNVTLLR